MQTILDFQGEDWEYFAVYPQPDVNFVSRGNDALFELFVAVSHEQNVTIWFH